MKFKILFAIFGIFLLVGCDAVEEVAPVVEEAEEVVEKVVPEEPVVEPVVVTPKPAEIVVPVEAEAASEPVVAGPAEAKEIVLAKCMTVSGAKLYTAEWCGHCQNQKAAFGEGLEYLSDIECAASGGWAQQCTDAGVKAVPAWIFGDGTMKTGNTPLATLASLTGCTY